MDVMEEIRKLDLAGTCDTCGYICDEQGCIKDSTHEVALNADGTPVPIDI